MPVRIPRHRSSIQRFLTNEHFYNLVIVVVTLASSFLAWWQASDKPIKSVNWILVVFLVAVFLVSVAKEAVLWWCQQEQESPHALEGSLHTLHALLLATQGSNDLDPNLRITVHCPIDKGQMLQQIVEYVGYRRDNAPQIGRKFRAQSGIIGKAFREGDVCFADRENDDYESYVKELVAKWNYTAEDARKLYPAAMAWMAIPIKPDKDGKVEAIVYLESTRRGYFSEGTTGKYRQQLATCACVGIARFLKDRYNS